MQFLIYCIDKPGHAHLRAATRPDHLAYLETHEGRVVVGGPILTEDGSGMIGSMLVIEAESRAEAEAFQAGDPYAKAGLFQSAEVRPWRQVFPRDKG
jgi:uncharacterized protein YciI